MEKKYYAPVFTLFILVICLVALRYLYTKTAKITGSYDEYTRIEKMQITDKYTQGQGNISKLFYSSDKKKYYVVINERKCIVDEKLYNEYNIGDEIDVKIEGVKTFEAVETFSNEMDISYSVNGVTIWERE